MRIFFILIALAIFVASCDSSRVYEDNRDFEGKFWHVDTVPLFEFNIQDPSIEYNAKVNIRNAFSYPFYNLYYQYELLDSNGNSLKKDLVEIHLFDKISGKPLGDGLGDLFDHQQEIMGTLEFPSEGKYSIRLKQYMRMDSLPSILSVGVRVEKAID